MIKLSDIIKSGGGNAKINRFINRYVLSKKEKKDIINEIKEGGGSSISENKKYFKPNINITKLELSEYIEGNLYQGLGNIPIRNLTVYSGFTLNYISSINGLLYCVTYKNNSNNTNVDIPYYVIDFNSKECLNATGVTIRYNNYPHIVLKNAYLESGLEIPEQYYEIINTIETLFNQIFTEITKEEYLEIHNQCIAGTWVPEWE